jgi:hypothetical protein
MFRSAAQQSDRAGGIACYGAVVAHAVSAQGRVFLNTARACKVRFTRTQTSREVRILPLADIAGLLCDHFVGESLQRVGYLRAERSVSLHELLMCMRGFAARRASIDVILEKNHMTDAAARAAPKISNR